MILRLEALGAIALSLSLGLVGDATGLNERPNDPIRCNLKSARSLDHLIGQQQEFARDYEPQLSRRFQIEDEF